MSVASRPEAPSGTSPAPQTQPPPSGLSATGVTAVVLSLIGWTTIPLFLRQFYERPDWHIDGFTANGWRYAISALIWGPALIWAWKVGKLPRGVFKAALIPSFWNAAAQVCFGLAPYYIEPGLMTFSLRLQIVFLAVAAAMMFPAERKVLKNPLFLAALALTLIATMSTVALNPKGLGDAQLTGVLLAIGSGVGYAMYALAVRKHMTGMNPILAFAAVSQYTAAALVGCMLLFAPEHGMSVTHNPDPMMWTCLIASSVIGIGLGHTFYFYAIARIGLVVAAGVIQLQPITVSIASMFLFKEAMTGWQWTTGLIAVAGAMFMLVVQHRVLSRARP